MNLKLHVEYASAVWDPHADFPNRTGPAKSCALDRNDITTLALYGQFELGTRLGNNIVSTLWTVSYFDRKASLSKIVQESRPRMAHIGSKKG